MPLKLSPLPSYETRTTSVLTSASSLRTLAMDRDARLLTTPEDSRRPCPEQWIINSVRNELLIVSLKDPRLTLGLTFDDTGFGMAVRGDKLVAAMKLTKGENGWYTIENQELGTRLACAPDGWLYTKALKTGKVPVNCRWLWRCVPSVQSEVCRIVSPLSDKAIRFCNDDNMMSMTPTRLRDTQWRFLLTEDRSVVISPRDRSTRFLFTNHEGVVSLQPERVHSPERWRVTKTSRRGLTIQSITHKKYLSVVEGELVATDALLDSSYWCTGPVHGYKFGLHNSEFGLVDNDCFIRGFNGGRVVITKGAKFLARRNTAVGWRTSTLAWQLEQTQWIGKFLISSTVGTGRVYLSRGEAGYELHHSEVPVGDTSDTHPASSTADECAQQKEHTAKLLWAFQHADKDILVGHPTIPGCVVFSDWRDWPVKDSTGDLPTRGRKRTLETAVVPCTAVSSTT